MSGLIVKSQLKLTAWLTPTPSESISMDFRLLARNSLQGG